MYKFSLRDFFNSVSTTGFVIPEYFHERYDIIEKPEYKKERIKYEISSIKESIEYFDRIISSYIDKKEKLKEKLKEIEKDLENIK